MELNIKTDPEIDMLNAALGISEERADELNKSMDEYVDTISDVHSLADSFKAIASFCDNKEELAYCMFTHGAWAADNLKSE